MVWLPPSLAIETEYIVKAFLLAAGHGSRLRPITENIPKCLVPIRGVPLLAIWLELCKRNGIEEVLINLHTHADLVREFLSRNTNGIRTQVMVEEQLLGSAGTLRANRHWIASDDLFWVFYADVLNRANLSGMLRMHRERRPCATIGVYNVADPERCGVVKTDAKGVIHEFIEKPAQPVSNLAFSGLMIAAPELLNVIPDRIPSDIGFHVLPQLTGRMLAYPIRDYLVDVGTLENYEKAQATWPGLPEANGFAPQAEQDPLLWEV
jgi:mannose-1-phosphate guanylyltransferase